MIVQVRFMASSGGLVYQAFSLGRRRASERPTDNLVSCKPVSARSLATPTASGFRGCAGNFTRVQVSTPNMSAAPETPARDLRLFFAIVFGTTWLFQLPAIL